MESILEVLQVMPVFAFQHVMTMAFNLLDVVLVQPDSELQIRIFEVLI